mmetsp:Transcript_51480/g.129168  ORF Transcript_51480/g.129168 Transcript_51480/m.129168 type:complete len:521 (-) Transcript_51480:103-1665(-)|eukprot:CAMPEP_0177638736 /NCGR_PEP_ID=MMETSP0447-20121125/5650_1 /TAXON_ID=0 /ORGANISM="Stygamoeba regulata, Strain BSH-02190019" /LENGTH=520 /DNA_ID=CAMNT_0019140723 /DNA_START=70 /DNA_END=1632 /DNA_ORIENTATION=-
MAALDSNTASGRRARPPPTLSKEVSMLDSRFTDYGLEEAVLIEKNLRIRNSIKILIEQTRDQEAFDSLSITNEKLDSLLECVPGRKIVKRKDPGDGEVICKQLFGPEADRKTVEVSDYACGRSSTLATEKFYARLMDGCFIAALANGHAEDDRALDASTKAASTFVDYIDFCIHRITSLKELGKAMIKAVALAHTSITAGLDKDESVCPCSLSGVVCIQMKKEFMGFSSDKEYACLCINVGRNFVYYTSVNGAVVNMTPLSTLDGLSDVGSIGPSNSGGHPDLKNLELFYRQGVAQDTVLMFTEAVAASLHPSLSTKPADHGLKVSSWSEVSQKQLQKICARYMDKVISTFTVDDPDDFYPDIIARKFIKSAQNLAPAQYKPNQDRATVHCGILVISITPPDQFYEMYNCNFTIRELGDPDIELPKLTEEMHSIRKEISKCKDKEKKSELKAEMARIKADVAMYEKEKLRGKKTSKPLLAQNLLGKEGIEASHSFCKPANTETSSKTGNENKSASRTHSF